MHKILLFILLILELSYSGTESGPDSLTDSLSDTTENLDIKDSLNIWESPFFSLGCGWQFGKNRLFDKWTNALEKSLDDIDYTFPDSLNPKFKISDNAPKYNVSFPIIISMFPIVNSSVKIGFNISWERLFKKLTASVKSDSAVMLYNFSKSLSSNSFSIGTEVYKKISDRFFSVNKVNETDFFIGLSGSPINLLHIKKSENSVIKSNLVGYGVGINWRVGISLFSKLSNSGSAFSYGIAYSGSFYTHFMSNGNHILYSDLLYNSDRDIIRYMNSSMVIFFNLIF